MSRWNQSYDHLRDYYKLPARKNAPVRYKGRPARVIAASGQYVRLHFDGDPKPDNGTYHPTWEMEWLEKPNA